MRLLSPVGLAGELGFLAVGQDGDFGALSSGDAELALVERRGG